MGQQQEHNHGGTPTYVGYAQGCRHPDCLTAFNEYKLRLAARKLQGDFVDLRRRENRLVAEAQAFSVQQGRPVTGETQSAPAPADPETPDSEPVVVADEPLALPAPPANPEPAEDVEEDCRAAEESADEPATMDHDTWLRTLAAVAPAVPVPQPTIPAPESAPEPSPPPQTGRVVTSTLDAPPTVDEVAQQIFRDVVGTTQVGGVIPGGDLLIAAPMIERQFGVSKDTAVWVTRNLKPYIQLTGRGVVLTKNPGRI